MPIFMKICIFHWKIRKFDALEEIAGFCARCPCHEARSEGVVARPQRRRRSTERFWDAPKSPPDKQNLSKTLNSQTTSPGTTYITDENEVNVGLCTICCLFAVYFG